MEVGKLIPVLKKRFIELYGSEPSLICQSPGRVNLIGEHIDYNDFGVLPLAINRRCYIMAGHSNTLTIKINNYDENCVKLELPLSSMVNIELNTFSWCNYVLCALKHFNSKLDIINYEQGINILVFGDIPQRSGLSSSSALICSSYITFNALNLLQNGKNKTLDLSETNRLLIAKECCLSERLIGTNGGGMDQTISLISKQGFAQYIEFRPFLKATPVKIPNCLNIFICHSMVECAKAQTELFNIRVVECRLAAKFIAFNLKLENWKAIQNLGELYLNVNPSKPIEMLNIIDSHNIFDETKSFSIGKLLKAFDLNSFDELCLIEGQLNKFQVESNVQFELYKRSVHVYSEIQRVLDFVDKCKSIHESESLKNQTDISLLGNLMNESHTSCKNWYECSCNELDRLVDICLKSGACGSRMTGAGWGGFVVSIVPIEKTESFKNNLESFYKTEYNIDKMDNYLITCSPSEGSNIINL